MFPSGELFAGFERGRGSADLRWLWLPSQNGLFAVTLHPHRWASPVVSAVKTIGVNNVPLWAPSQNGWLADLPQLHQAYFFPSCNLTMQGAAFLCVCSVIFFLVFGSVVSSALVNPCRDNLYVIS